MGRQRFLPAAATTTAALLALLAALAAGYTEEGLFDVGVDPFEADNLLVAEGGAVSADRAMSTDEIATVKAALVARLDYFDGIGAAVVPDVQGTVLAQAWTQAGGVVPWMEVASGADRPPLPGRPADETAPAEDAPHLVLVLVDDVGLNDIGYLGSSWLSFATPHLDALAAQGVNLENHYTGWVCAPTRAALLTGRYAIRLGYALAPNPTMNLPLGEVTLAQELQRRGYRTALVGKWHMGVQAWAYTPLYRGFDSYYGYYSGSVGYFSKQTSNGFLDLTDGLAVESNPAKLDRALHLTTLLQREAEAVVGAHAAAYPPADGHTPLFLYYAMQNVHEGAAEGMEAPPEELAKCAVAASDGALTDAQIAENVAYCALIVMMDDAIGRLHCALEESTLSDGPGYVMVVASDNGGLKDFPGSSAPFRGAKGSMGQGGIRNFGLVYGSSAAAAFPEAARGTSYAGLVHVSDWFPTLLGLAAGGGGAGGLPGTVSPANGYALDGVDVWDALVTGGESPRTEVFHNYDEDQGVGAMQIRTVKLLVGNMAPPMAADIIFEPASSSDLLGTGTTSGGDDDLGLCAGFAAYEGDDGYVPPPLEEEDEDEGGDDGGGDGGDDGGDDGGGGGDAGFCCYYTATGDACDCAVVANPIDFCGNSAANCASCSLAEWCST